MADTAFNTIAEVQRLRDAGFAQAQAEAITLSIHAGVTGGVASKADLGVLRADLGVLRADLGVLRADLERVEERLQEKIENQGVALEATIVSQGAALDAKIEKQGAALNAKINSQSTALNAKIDSQGAELRKEISVAKFDLTWRLLGGIAVLNGMLLAAMRLLPPG